MPTPAFSNNNSQMSKLLYERQQALRDQIELLEKKDVVIQQSITDTSSVAVQFDVSEDVSDQVGHTDNRFTVSTDFFPQSVKVYYNGFKQINKKHFYITSLRGINLLFTPAPSSNVEIVFTPIDMSGYTSTVIELFNP